MTKTREQRLAEHQLASCPCYGNLCSWCYEAKEALAVPGDAPTLTYEDGLLAMRRRVLSFKVDENRLIAKPHITSAEEAKEDKYWRQAMNSVLELAAETGSLQHASKTVAPTDAPSNKAAWWCCKADYGEHEPTCANYEASAPEALSEPPGLQPEMPADALEAADAAVDQERVAQLIAHRACCGIEHDPQNGKLHGYCVICGVPWPCEYAGKPPAPEAPSEPPAMDVELEYPVPYPTVSELSTPNLERARKWLDGNFIEHRLSSSYVWSLATEFQQARKDEFTRGRNWELAEYQRHSEEHYPGPLPGLCSWCRGDQQACLDGAKLALEKAAQHSPYIVKAVDSAFEASKRLRISKSVFPEERAAKIAEIIARELRALAADPNLLKEVL